ncbi:hypothetical protein N9812_02060 [bacterium]|nr:hypothetical protein [bacterium]
MSGPRLGIWGQPGYPLLPIPFRDATPISPKLALLSGCSTSSELDATFWATHESAPKALLEAVLVEAVRRADIHGKYLLGPLPDPAVTASWPISTRARNTLNSLAASQGQTVFELATLRNQRNVGDRTTLELLIAFEVFGIGVDPTESQIVEASELIDQKNTYSNAQSVRLPEQQIPSSARPQPVSGPRLGIWGQPGYPLLPIPFRDATPISPKLALLSGCSTSSELDATFWATHESAPKALLEAVLVEAVRRADIHGKYLLGPLPDPAVTASWPISTRARNTLNSLAASQGQTVFELATLRNQRNVGDRTTLELLIAFEVFGFSVVPTESEIVEASELIDQLSEALSRPYAARLVFSDVRLGRFASGRDFVTSATESIEALSSGHSLEAMQTAKRLLGAADCAAELANQSLDVALHELIKFSGCSAKNMPAMMARFGLHGRPPATLEASAMLVGVTRERIRQIEKKIRTNLHGNIWLPQLETALETVAAAAPIDQESMADLLMEHGLATEPLRFETLKTFAKIAGLTCDLAVVDGIVATPQEQGATKADKLDARDLERTIKRISRPHGFVHEAILLDELTRRRGAVDRSSLTGDLESIERSIALPDGWWWVPPNKGKYPPALNVARKISLVAGRPFTARDLRRALLRLAASRGAGEQWAHPAPPSLAVKEWARLHPEIEWSADTETISVHVDDPNSTLGDTEWVLVDILSSSPGGIATRADVMRAGVEMGLNASTLSFCLSFSAVVEQVEYNVWGLRGAERDSQAIDILRTVSASQPKTTRRTEAITADHVRIRYELSLSDLVSPNVYFSATAQELLRDELAAVDANGNDYGVIRVESGKSWGYKPFVSAAGAEEGDVLVVVVDFAGSSATLSIDEGPA